MSRRRPSPRRSPGSGTWRQQRGETSPSASGCTPSRGTPPMRRGPRPTGCSPASTTTRSPRSRRASRAASRRGSGGCSSSTRQPRQPRDLPEPLGGGGAGAWRGRHRAGRKPQEVADRIEEYHRLGIDEFVLSAIPISRAPTGSARVSCPSSSAADWTNPGADRRQRIVGALRRQVGRLVNPAFPTVVRRPPPPTTGMQP